MHFKINKISTLNQKMKTSKTLSLSWQNKLISTALASVSLFLGAPQLALATLPSTAGSNLSVIAGTVPTANITTTGANTTSSINTLTIQPTSTNTVLNWNNFSDGTASGGLLGLNDTVTFQLPTTSSGVLNNIAGLNPTVLAGNIRSNGNVFFLNPAGIVVTSQAQINVGGFYASTVPDANAISYFYNNGTLGVFAGLSQNLTNAASQSGVIYIQSGANIVTNNSSAGVNLASAYVGTSGVNFIVGSLVGSLAATSMNTAASTVTLNTGSAVASTGSVGAVQVDSTNVNGNLTIISLGGSAGSYVGVGLPGNSTTVTSGYNSSGAIAGGSMSITTNGGAVTLNGNVSTSGNIVVNTIGSNSPPSGAVTLNGSNNITPASGYTIAAGGLLSVTASGAITSTNATLTSGGNMILTNSGTVTPSVITLNNVNAAGTLTLTTNNGDISNPSPGASTIISNTGVVSSGSDTISTGVNAGARGIITLNGQLPSGSITGYAVTITDSGAATYSSVTAGGSTGCAARSSIITTTNGNLTITQLTSNGSFSGISNLGTASIGSSAALSTINGLLTITGNSGASLYTANVYNIPSGVAGKLVITTENTSTALGAPNSLAPTYTTGANITVANVTVNGDIQAYVKTLGTVGLTNVGELVNSSWTTINATTAAGAINLTGITTNNGQITANSQSGYGAATGGYTITLSTVNNQTVNSNANSGVSFAQSFDTFTTANGSISVSGLITKNTDVILAANATGSSGTGTTQNAKGVLVGADPSLSSTTSNTGNANLMAVGNITTPTTSLPSSINYVGTNPSSALTVTTANGYINLSNISISTGNTVSLTVPTLNNQVTFKANSDLTVTLNISGQTLNQATAISSLPGSKSYVAGLNGIVPDTQATTPVYLSATGNLAVTSVNSWGVGYPIQLIAPQITLCATNNITSSIAVETTAYKTSFITIQTANTLSLSNISNSANPVTSGTIAALTAVGTATPNTLTLTSTSGNVNLDSALGASPSGGVGNVNTDPALTVTATTGNINVSAIVTSNTTSLTAGTGIANYTPSLSATGTLIIANNNTLTVNAPQVNLGTNSTSITASNQIPNLIATGGANGITINSGGGTSGYTTLNINTGTNVAGNLTITTNTQGVNIGLNSADTIQVLGNTVINTANTITSTGAILSNASSPNLFGNVSLTTKDNTIQLGASNSASNYGQISASAGSGSITINEGGVTNLGNVTTTGTLIINASAIVNNSGTVTAVTANLSTGTALAPGSIAIGQVANPAAITNVNVLNAGTFSYNSGTSNTTITANGQNIATLVLVGGGNLNYYQTGGSVGTVTDTVSGSGTLGYGLTNAQTTAATLTNLGTGSMQVTANGTGSLGALTLNFGGTGTASSLSTITNNSSWTVSNVTSGSNYAGDVTFNAAATSSSKNNLTIGSNVVLPGTGKITFTTGNLNYGTVADTAGSAMTLNATQGSAAFTGNNISITNASSVMGTIAFTSNGNVTYTNNGNIILAASSLGATASGANTIQSVTGNISQTGVLTVLGVNTPISFLASTTNNNGVMLTQTNLVNGSARNTISITGSGNSAYYSGNTTGIYLGTVNIGYNTSPAGSQFTACATSTANINETSGIYVWGNTSLIANGGNVVMTAAGNNFGAITATATSTGNISITEAATSSYLQVNTSSGNFTAQSVTGDIITSTQTNNSAIVVGGNSNINAAGQISLTNSGDKFNGVGYSTTLTSGSNATLLGTQSASNAYLIIGSGTNVKGNLIVTNTYSGGQINDQGSTSSITVNGTSAFLETGLNGSSVANGQVNLTGQNNVFTGGLSIQGFIANIYTLGNVIILPASTVTNANYTSLNGNISTAGLGGSNFGTLNLNAPFGSITVNNSLIINVGMTLTGINADLSFLSLTNELKGNSPNHTGITGVYKPPVN